MARATTRSSSTTRPKRVPVSGNRDILTVSGKDDAYEYRIVNDRDNRIQKFKDGGWEIADGDEQLSAGSLGDASAMGSIKSKDVGQGTHGIVMKIKKEWYDEDQKAKSSHTDAKEAGLHQNDIQGGYGKVEIK